LFAAIMLLLPYLSINVKNFHGSLTTVVMAQNDTSKTANITDTISIEHWYSHTSDAVLKIGQISLPAYQISTS